MAERSSTSPATRFFMGFMALLFLGSASALVIAIIVQGVQSKHKENSANKASTSQTSTNKETKKLIGTKLTNFTPEKAAYDQLQVVDTTVGTGATVKAGDTVTADYVGALAANGTIFDASVDHGGPQTFSLSGVIAGWSQGIPGMKVGGTRRLLIPATLGYGSQPQTDQNGNVTIPANSDLVFDVTITKIGQ